MMVDIRDFHRRAAGAFGARVQAVRDDQWTLPTPCAEWNVRDLVHHLVHENRWTAPLMQGSTLEEVGDRFEGDLLGEDPKSAWQQSVDEAVKSVRAVPLNRTVHLSYGDVPARHYAFELATDHLIHAWDLARAIGADESLDQDLVELVYRKMKPREDALKVSGLFGTRVEPPEDADLQTRLLAVYGRVA
ncbi:MAG TPA: TIGR03086 family metal-binding protein [Actinomycetota bacterium]|nr:TIGR03086 family metal-binding protein [Actinomycetota bacterium]